MDWTYMDDPVRSVDDMPSDVIGFVYLIKFTDDTSYIGKKNIYSMRVMKPLKSGKAREGQIDVIYKNTGEGHRQMYAVVRKESDWKAYQGSNALCKIKTPRTKEILCYAATKLELTYLEAKMQFIYGVLEKQEYLNDNILGSFYKDKLWISHSTKLPLSKLLELNA